MMTVQQAFELALQHHQAGRLAEAEAIYRQILNVHPNHAGALHYLGVIAYQAGQLDSAVEWMRRAVALDPQNSAAHYNLGAALRDHGQIDEAIAAYRRAIALQPDDADTQNNLGNALRDRGQSEEAMRAYQRALALHPGHAEAHNNLGITFRERGQPEEAMASFRRALLLKPEFAEALHNLGGMLAARGEIPEAIAACQRAVEIKPGFPDAQVSLGNALRLAGQRYEAIAAFRRALEIDPKHADAWNNLGLVLNETGQLDEAVEACRRALEIRPDFPEAYVNLGNSLNRLLRFDEAVAAYRHALHLNDRHLGAHNNLGVALAKWRRSEEAAAAFRAALAIDPDYAEAHSNLGNVLKDLGQMDDALAAYRQANELAPNNADMHSNLIYAHYLHPHLNEEDITAEKARWNRQFCGPLKGCVRAHSMDSYVERRLRIGYVSPDFTEHVVGFNLRPLFKYHDRGQIEIICYSGVIKPDSLTAEFRQRADLWRDTVGVGDETVADMIRRDGVDILVDLSQHTAGNRLPVFARWPAPVQVSFAGYPESTGVEAIEYRISDRWLEVETESVSGREGSPRVPKEHIFHLESFWCYDPRGMEVEVNELPARANGWVTFGCLNNFCKVNEPVLKLWARVLGQVPEARLVMLSALGSHRQRTVEFLEREGVAPRRVEFVEPRPREEYLQLYHRLDMVLDTFPYNGHTTSLDALWMGVPVVSLAGKTPVSRAGLSQLSNLGLPELVAHSEDEYVEIAVRLAGDLPRLAELRRTLRTRMEGSVLMDAPRFARNIEAAYRTMWRQWCTEGTGP